MASIDIYGLAVNYEFKVSWPVLGQTFGLYQNKLTEKM
jgi:hypothetical protein